MIKYNFAYKITNASLWLLGKGRTKERKKQGLMMVASTAPYAHIHGGIGVAPPGPSAMVLNRIHRHHTGSWFLYTLLRHLPGPRHG